MSATPKKLRLRLNTLTLRQLTDLEAAEVVGASNPCSGTCEPGCSGHCASVSCKCSVPPYCPDKTF